jgi:hypothetical protein
MTRHVRIIVLGAAWAATGLAAAPPENPAHSSQHGILHVNALTGTDAAHCGAHAGRACRTIQAAIDQILIMPRSDVVIRIGPGEYEGGILLAGREMPGSARLTLSGEPGLTRLVARDGEPVGLTIRRSGGVVLENLEIEGFTQAGIEVLFSSEIEVRSTTLSGNRDGLFLGQSETFIRDGVIQSNLRHGISCEGGWVIFTHDPAGGGLVLTDNATSGLRVDRCHARFESPGLISGSPLGLVARNAGVISLNMRGDVRVVTESGQTALNADCHGMVEGYANSCVGDCTCRVTLCGLCVAGGTPGSGGAGRGTRLHEPS